MALASLSPAASDDAPGWHAASAPLSRPTMTLQAWVLIRVARSGPAGGVCP